jgi:hypothetical protein
MDSRHNTDALYVGTGEFSFCEGATTLAEALAKGYIDIGNVKVFQPVVEMQKLVHVGCYRGRKIRDVTVVTQQDISYKLTGEEWKKNNLLVLYGASEGAGHTQSAQAAANADALDFTIVNSDPSRWYDITKASAHIINLTTVTIATKTEGTDFELDKTLGKIRFITVQTTSLTPVITAPAITANDATFMPSLLPGGNLIRSGFGRLTFYDRGGVGIDHRDFLCDLTCEGADQIDGDKWAALNLVVAVNSTVPGEVFYAKKRGDIKLS